MEKSFKALKSGGKIIIYDFFLDDAKCEPSRIDSFLMSMHMQLITNGGSQFSHSEMKDMLSKAGFKDVLFTRINKHQDVAVATKP